MSDGVAFNSISGSFLEKVTGNEPLRHDLPRKPREAKREPRSGEESHGPTLPDTDAQGPDQDMPAHIDLRI